VEEQLGRASARTRCLLTALPLILATGSCASQNAKGTRTSPENTTGALDAAADAGGPQNEGGLAGDPSWLIESGDAVFFVGNSFFGGDDNRLADLVASLGRQVRPAITIQTGQHVVYGNQPLSWFFQQSESQAAIRSGRYKIFVLQGEEREPVDHEADFKQAVRDYHRAVTQNGGTIMLFMTWDFYWERDSSFFEQLSAAYEEIGRELNVPVIPVGLIYDDCNQQPYGNEQPYWLTNQELHQNDKGTVVNTYATFSMLTGIDPMGQTFVIPYADPPVPAPVYEYLSEKSWARVAPRLRE
jgi:hypothetical protein